MDYKDLMVGDWVICNDLKRQVAAIGETVGFLDCNNQVYWAYGGFDRIDYIPLTESILVKNGFEKKDYFTYVSGQVEIIKNRDFWNVVINKYCVFVDMNIKFVHELQHLLRLCGIEKELTI